MRAHSSRPSSTRYTPVVAAVARDVLDRTERRRPAGSERLLQGTGNVARHVVLDRAQVLDSPGVQAWIDAALDAAGQRSMWTSPAAS
jgi:hypothetical protein